MADVLRPGQLAECDPKLIDRLLASLENDIIPLSQQAVQQGNKVFGAAILKKDDLSLVVAGSNHETLNPLWHGVVYTI
jgi:tRNA(Arg) A34 adenosine deaminase TadA